DRAGLRIVRERSNFSPSGWAAVNDSADFAVGIVVEEAQRNIGAVALDSSVDGYLRDVGGIRPQRNSCLLVIVNPIESGHDRTVHSEVSERSVERGDRNHKWPIMDVGQFRVARPIFFYFGRDAVSNTDGRLGVERSEILWNVSRVIPNRRRAALG